MSSLDRARRYIAECPPAISGQGGHDATFHVAAVLVHGFALGDAEALALLREWNQSCQPQWSEADLIHKIKSVASASHQRPRGWLVANPGRTFGGAQKGTGGAPVVPKAEFKPEALKRIARKVSEIKDVVITSTENSRTSDLETSEGKVIRGQATRATSGPLGGFVLYVLGDKRDRFDIYLQRRESAQAWVYDTGTDPHRRESKLEFHRQEFLSRVDRVVPRPLRAFGCHARHPAGS